MDHKQTYLSISEIQKSFETGEFNLSEVVDFFSHQIEQQNPILNACITVLHPEVTSFEPEKPLAGIPFILKDLFETKGIATTAGAEFLRNNIPKEDAFVVSKLKEAGAIILGKSNMHEIALGVTNINPHFGTCRNPWNIQHISGGSSGGSAVAVAAGMCIAALGSDTGGSIRIPSSFCGTVGLKPTYGRISLNGVMPLSWNLDHVGPITNNVRDAAIILQVLAGFDPSDPTSIDHPVDDYLSEIEKGVNGWKIAFLQGDYINESQPEVISALQNVCNVLNNLGAKTRAISVPWLDEATLANGILTQTDAAACHRDRLTSHPEAFGEDVLIRLKTGSAFTSSEYSQARRVQMIIKRKFKQLFEDYDLLMLPTTPCTAPLIEGLNAIDQARKLTRLTSPFNLAGLPAMSLPCGSSLDGLPIGLQIVGSEWEEAKVLRAGKAFEESTNWHDMFPPKLLNDE